jgi:hypothetical protein
LDRRGGRPVRRSLPLPRGERSSGRGEVATLVHRQATDSAALVRHEGEKGAGRSGLPNRSRTKSLRFLCPASFAQREAPAMEMATKAAFAALTASVASAPCR